MLSEDVTGIVLLMDIWDYDMLWCYDCEGVSGAMVLVAGGVWGLDAGRGCLGTVWLAREDAIVLSTSTSVAWQLLTTEIILLTLSISIATPSSESSLVQILLHQMSLEKLQLKLFTLIL